MATVPIDDLPSNLVPASDLPESVTPRKQSAPKKQEYVDTRSSPALGATTDVLNRAFVAGTLGGPVDIAALAMRPFGYKEEQPVLGSEWIGQQMERAGMVSPTRRPVAEFLTGVAPVLLTGGSALVKSGAGLAKRALGGEATTAAKTAQKSAAGQYAAPLSEAEAKQSRAQKAIEQMERQPAVATQRAANVPLTSEQQQGTMLAQLRTPVRQQAAGQRMTAQQQAAAAQSEAAAAQQRVVEADQTVKQLEQVLLSNPGMSADQLGTQLRSAVQKLENDLVSNRAKETRFGEVLNQRGNEVIVDTAALRDKANEIIRTSRNPQIIAMMQEIRQLATTNKIEGLSLPSADSLRKYLSKDIIKKFFAETGADKETLRALKTLRGELIEKTPQEYKEALGMFSTLSRGLDIVERQGALRKIVDVDPMSTAAKLTEAEVTGQIIQKANAGNPVFTRLLEVQPGLKDSARLYFTQDLFGKGAVPNDSALRTWLKANERSLKQLGLYEEFNGMKNAKVAAQKAVNDAKTEATAAKAGATKAEQEASKALSVSKKSEQRLQEALRQTNKKAKTETSAAPIQTFVGTRDQQAKAAAAMEKMQSDILTANKPEEIVKAVSRAADDLYARGIIDIDGRNLMKSEIQNVQTLVDARNKARKVLTMMGGSVGALVGVGYYGRRGVESMFQ